MLDPNVVVVARIPVGPVGAEPVYDEPDDAVGGGDDPVRRASAHALHVDARRWIGGEVIAGHLDRGAVPYGIR